MNSSWFLIWTVSSSIAFSLCAERQEWNFFDNELTEDTETSYETQPNPLAEIAEASYDDEEMQTSSSARKSSYPSQDINGSMFATAQPKLESGWGVVAFGDWLYWRAKEEGLVYGLQSFNFGQNPEVGVYQGIRGTLSAIPPKYHSGYRVGIDLVLPRGQWDVLFAWTRYQNTVHDAIHQKTNNIVWPYYLNNNAIPNSLSANAEWNLNYNTVDLELGRSFFVGKHLSIRPFIAFQAAWIEQNLNIYYNNVSFVLSAATQAFIRSHNHSNFKGYGLRAGLDTKWPLIWGFSFLGDFSVSLLSSSFDIKQIEKNADHSQRTHQKDHLNLSTRVLQAFGGIEWEQQFYKDKLYLNLHAGWEQGVWFDQNQLSLFFNQSFSRTNIGTSKNQQADLTFSGWTFGVTFGF